MFENLLAAYNPETRDTVRLQTGSDYAPRPVVDCMAEEALAATFAQACSSTAGDVASWQERIRYLLDYAVGSGAFPMAVLHKLPFALRRLDPPQPTPATTPKRTPPRPSERIL